MNPINSGGNSKLNGQKLCNAIKEKKQAKISYKGHERIINPHLIGIHKDTGNKVLRAFHVKGYSSSGDKPGWRLFSINKIVNVQVLDTNFQTQQGYNPNNKVISEFICRIEPN